MRGILIQPTSTRDHYSGFPHFSAIHGQPFWGPIPEYVTSPSSSITITCFVPPTMPEMARRIAAGVIGCPSGISTSQRSSNQCQVSQPLNLRKSVIALRWCVVSPFTSPPPELVQMMKRLIVRHPPWAPEEQWLAGLGGIQEIRKCCLQ